MNRYIISRTSNSSNAPCPEALRMDATYLRKTRFNSLEEAIKSSPHFAEYPSHRTMNGKVIFENPTKVWFIEAESIEEVFLKYGDEMEELVVKNSNIAEIPIELEIYDDYRE